MICLTHGRVRALILAVLLAFGLMPQYARATETYAPVFRWAVDNWYQGKPQWHKRWFPGISTVFSVDWHWTGVVGDKVELTCEENPGAVRYWKLDNSLTRYVPENGLPGHNALAATSIYVVECNGSGQSGPWDYRSGASRHWTCGDNYWREPTYPEYEKCDRPDNAPEPDKNKGKPDCPNCDGVFGDPIFVATGNKYETRTEFRGNGAMPLEFSWTYNSTGGTAASNAIGDMVGVNRTTTFSQSVSVSTSVGISTAYVSRPDGKAARFTLTNGVWLPSGGQPETLLQLNDGWRYQDRLGNASNFDTDGRLTSIEAPSGERVTVGYDATGRVDYATDEAGRVMTFAYDVANRLHVLTPPDGNVITFDYLDNGGLQKVTYANGASITYLYDEPAYSAANPNWLLTGEVDQDGTRTSTTIYDATGRATETYGPSRVADESATTTVDASGYFTNASITEAAGAKRDVTFVVKKGRILPATSQRSCAGCATSSVAYTYDDDGNPDLPPAAIPPVTGRARG